ncbi:MAG TPA: hypothetical protein VFV63_17355 [Ilumatobacteraceae bacterium]|nr:hypothetical protein [Ilumatobacteraceae bacterium]
MRRVVELAGRDIELSADDESRWDAIEALFGGCAESTNAAQLRLRFDRTPPELPDRPADLSYTGIDVWLGGDGAACRSATGVAAMRHGDDIDVGGPLSNHDDVDRVVDRATGCTVDAGDLASAFRRSVQHVLADALAEHGRHTLHAASIRRGDEVMVALGGTGAGKSTLAYAASLRGWSVLSDDLTFVTTDPDDTENVLAWGLPKPLNIPGNLIAGDHGGLALPNDERMRVRLPLGRSSAPGAGRVTAVLLVEHSTGAGYVQRITAGPDLFKMLLPSFPLAPDRRRMQELFPIAAKLSRLPAWTVRHDSEPARRLDMAGTLLEQIVETLDPPDAHPSVGPLTATNPDGDQ